MKTEEEIQTELDRIENKLQELISRNDTGGIPDQDYIHKKSVLYQHANALRWVLDLPRK